ncbi:MAG: hypothetical protein QM504_06610 [Pseudomonadota bacterium]
MSLLEMRNIIDRDLRGIYSHIGCDAPENHEQILEFCLDDVVETAEPDSWHSGDVAIAFRRYLESEPIADAKNVLEISDVRAENAIDGYCSVNVYSGIGVERKSETIAVICLDTLKVFYIGRLETQDGRNRVNYVIKTHIEELKKKYIKERLFFQPEGMEGEGDYPSFGVWFSYHGCAKLFPGQNIVAYSDKDIEDPTYMDV